MGTLTTIAAAKPVVKLLTTPRTFTLAYIRESKDYYRPFFLDSFTPAPFELKAHIPLPVKGLHGEPDPDAILAVINANSVVTTDKGDIEIAAAYRVVTSDKPGVQDALHITLYEVSEPTE